MTIRNIKSYYNYIQGLKKQPSEEENKIKLNQIEFRELRLSVSRIKYGIQDLKKKSLSGSNCGLYIAQENMNILENKTRESF